MNRRSLFWLCAVSAGCLIFSVFAVTQLSHASQTAAKPASDAPANVVRTDYPDWPWPRGVHEPAKPDDGQRFHIPGSTQSYTDTQINRSTSTVDWFPELHPAPPVPVISGKTGAYHACGQCHLIDGRGKPDTADLRGLQVAYVLQQLSDMKDGTRHGSVPHATIKDMIPIAKAIDEADAKLAAEYSLSIPATRGIRVVETDIVPVTHPGPHGIQLVDASGAKEPIGIRIIEVPEDVQR